MNEPPAELYASWRHSYEEDDGGVEVYRPESYAFPPARGRRGMEVRSDGSFVDVPIGRDDRPGALRGTWGFDEADQELRVTFDADETDARALEIVEVSPDVLKVRRRDASEPS